MTAYEIRLCVRFGGYRDTGQVLPVASRLTGATRAAGLAVTAWALAMARRALTLLSRPDVRFGHDRAGTGAWASVRDAAPARMLTGPPAVFVSGGAYVT